MKPIYCSCGEMVMVIEGTAKKKKGACILCRDCMERLISKSVRSPYEVPDFLSSFFGGALGKRKN